MPNQMMNGNWEGYNNYDHYYHFSQLDRFINEIFHGNIELVTSKNKEYFNVPCTLDIETSSTYINDEKFATMYLWGFGFNGSTIIGRTWYEFQELIKRLTFELGLSSNRYLICYIHNLGYEFQWIRKRFIWETDKSGHSKIFAMKERRPIYAITRGIEFKCSYILSNYALAYIGANLLTKYPVQKAVGDLDYSLVRHSETPLVDSEIWYQVRDCQVVMSYIQEKIESDGDITKIPLTNTGYVRKYVRHWCFTNNDNNPIAIKKISAKYHDQMEALTIKSEKEYDQLKDAFSGGFTHASARFSGKLVKNVTSKDEASAYPGAMVSDYYPVTAGVYIGDISISRLGFYLKNYCCLFTVTLYNVTPKFRYEHYISLSHCPFISDDYVTNNGRVAAASILTTTITELDWDIICKCYDFDMDSTEIKGLRVYHKGYLPKPYILAILNLYGDKTSLKGIEEKTTQYMVSKNMINASYGMAVTAIVRDEIIYDYNWGTEDADKMKQLVDYNNSYNRFLSYPWGVWVTAHARHNLWDAIFELGEDYIYSDTDSVKYINPEKHEEFFKKYNLNMMHKLMQMCLFYEIPFEKCRPTTKKGDKKLIGVWEDDGVYKTFKTIGAKRYMYENEDGSLNFTISGVNKHYGVPYLLHTFSQLNDDEHYELFKLAYSPDSRLFKESKEAMNKVIELHKSGQLSYDTIFEKFNEGLYFPPHATGKQTITYIDKVTSEVVVDYMGNKKRCSEFSSIHMEPQDYSMSRTQDYLDFLRGFQDATI